MRFLLSLFLLFIISCSQVEPSTTQTILDAEFEVELDETRALSIERGSGKFVSMFDTNTVPVIIQLKTPQGFFVSQSTAEVTGSKSLRLKRSDVVFYNNSSKALTKDIQGIRLFLGGRLEGSKIVYNGLGQMFVWDNRNYKQEVLNKIPYVSDWSPVSITETAGKLSISTNKLTLRPKGNLVRIRLVNNSRNLQLRKVAFSSQDVSGAGFYDVDSEDSWTQDRPIESNTYNISYAHTPVINFNKGQEMYYIVWLKQVPNNKPSSSLQSPWSRISLYLKDAQAGINFSITPWAKEGKIKRLDGVSSEVIVRLTDPLPIQPIFYMAPNFIQTNGGINFANTWAVRGAGTGHLYSLAKAKEMSNKSHHILARDIGTDGYWDNGSQEKVYAWHVANKNDIGGVFRQSVVALNQKSSVPQEEIETLKLDGRTSEQYYSLYYRPAWANFTNYDVFFALRFLKKSGGTYKATPYTAAFMYHREGEWKEVHTGNQTNLVIRVRPFGTFFGPEKYTTAYLRNQIATKDYWFDTNRNQNDIIRRLPARGQKRGSSELSNGYLTAFWVPKDENGNLWNKDAYTIFNKDNPSFYYTGSPVSVLNAQGYPILMFRNR